MQFTAICHASNVYINAHRRQPTNQHGTEADFNFCALEKSCRVHLRQASSPTCQPLPHLPLMLLSAFQAFAGAPQAEPLWPPSFCPICAQTAACRCARSRRHGAPTCAQELLSYFFKPLVELNLATILIIAAHTQSARQSQLVQSRLFMARRLLSALRDDLDDYFSERFAITPTRSTARLHNAITFKEALVVQVNLCPP